MLVLKRKPDETIVIETESGERIKIMVIDFRSGGVRLGIEASPATKVNRGEIQVRIDEQNKAVQLEYLKGMAIEIRSRREDSWFIIGYALEGKTHSAYSYLNRNGEWQAYLAPQCTWNTEEAARSFIQELKEAAL